MALMSYISWNIISLTLTRPLSDVRISST